MLAQLAELERQNVADSLMTNDSLAKALVAYFDDHGTRNERLRAHYILGRTYADLGEAPAALDAYLDAAACADTTAADCDWGKLSRVYSQLASIFYNQGLIEDFTYSTDYSIDCARKAKDTLLILRESLMGLTGYDYQDKFDTVASKFDILYEAYGKDYEKVLAQYSILPIRSLLGLKRLDEAKACLRLYEKHSGFVDSGSNVQQGKEVFYYFKGLYYSYMQRLDSAEYFFRKELEKGQDAENKNMAAYGLANLFMQAGFSDSAAKYALYAYAMNDSTYDSSVMEEVEKTKALYNYGRHQQIAFQALAKASQEQKVKVRLCVLLFSLLLVLCSVLVLWRKKKQEHIKKYQQKIEELLSARRELHYLQAQRVSYESQIAEKEGIIQQQTLELDLLKKHEKEFEKLIGDKESIIEQKGKELIIIQQQREQLLLQIVDSKELLEKLQADANKLQQDELLKEKLAESQLVKSPIYQWLERQSYAPNKLSDSEWENIEGLVREILPEFYGFLSSRKATFTNYEYKICLLFRLHIRMKQTAAFIGIAKSQVSTISTVILNREFQEVGSGKELKKRLERMS